jgi:gamma-glutamyltranspeptidase / glutathione hydrolase
MTGMNQRRAFFWILMVTMNVWTWQSSLGSDRSQGRSMVITPGGMVAAEHPLASQAGALILAQGGHAVDAALAANAAMGVLSPMMCGIGGDLFAMVYEAKTGRLHGLNASGWSPAAWSLESLKEQGHEKMPMEGMHAVTVPGAVDGWDKLLGKFGRKSFAEILAPAIHYAERGFPVTELVADYWSGEEEVRKLGGNPEATRVFLPGGKPPAVGELFRNPDLARAYGQIAAGGR